MFYLAVLTQCRLRKWSLPILNFAILLAFHLVKPPLRNFLLCRACNTTPFAQRNFHVNVFLPPVNHKGKNHFLGVSYVHAIWICHPYWIFFIQRVNEVIYRGRWRNYLMDVEYWYNNMLVGQFIRLPQFLSANWNWICWDQTTNTQISFEKELNWAGTISPYKPKYTKATNPKYLNTTLTTHSHTTPQLKIIRYIIPSSFP